MGLIAIVGRPNVGKSALFNRIAGRRIAIVHDEPGVTRDRVTAEAEWAGRPFTLVDTGGIGLLRREKADSVIAKAALEQVELAIEAASVIILVVNVQEGVVPLDREVSARLRTSGKTVLVAANKCDHEGLAEASVEFAELGFAKIFPVSAIHQRGIEALMDAAMTFVPAEAPREAAVEAEPALKLAIVGRPNVGKSSIINALTRSERVIVSPIPGTTRDAVDVPFEVETDGVRQRYVLIDTAGVRQERRIDNSVEFFSVKRTEESIGRCDIVIFVMDAAAGVTAQDKKVAGKIIEERKACILVINKWDLFAEQVDVGRKALRARQNKNRREGQEREMMNLSDFAAWTQKELFFLDYAPVIFTSATTGFQLERLLESIRYVAAQLQQKVPTAILNRTLRDAIERRQPVSSGGHRLKFFYATQVRQSPPTFLLFVNREDLFSDIYRRYLEGEMRRAFGYEGCAINMLPRAREKTIAPIRKSRPADRAPKAKAQGGHRTRSSTNSNRHERGQRRAHR
ncbi:MAG TPA: ribosome biogenesis GTPase Der [Verrucomicrobiae bacterium]|jgi:GTP-binding protein|nr:ribosome biogenesis GTPase Der [Verrucomicrobiae bacterium]